MMTNTILGRLREAFTVAVIALFVGLAVYTFLGLAWTFKTTVEVPSKIRHSLDFRS